MSSEPNASGDRSKPLRILIVEDDPLQRGDIKTTIAEAVPNSVLMFLGTEFEFRDQFRKWETEPLDVDVIVLDVMLQWTYPAREMPPVPDDVRREGFYRAGLRCVQLLRTMEKTKEVPVILLTALDASDVRGEVSSLIGKISVINKLSEGRLAEEIVRLRQSLTG